ncbi:cytotoxic translational repressor of toxin-antitoxin stability system [Sulfolobales archaeon HS-7]|nr:cytotoxic translational repressor of toxin-antitoxin stability system [Sulfolobales archaeon HS-7]
MVCKDWELKFMMRKVKSYREFLEYATDTYNDKLIMLISEKLELLQENPFKYSREKLGKDKYGNPMFSIEVTGDIRILYSADPKNCIVFIWEVGSHKMAYGP